jgi:predicted methyltransferase
MKAEQTTYKRVLHLVAAGMLLAMYSNAPADIAAGFDAALDADERSAEDKVRDAARKPKSVLEFVGIGAGMSVLDLNASSGWYTEVLSAAVGADGKVVSHNSARRRERTEPAIAAKAARLGNITPLFADTGSLGLDSEVDAAFTALNLHDLQNRSAEAGQQFLGDAFKALKPGGVFGVIDHEGSSGQDNSSLHRLEVAVAKEALEMAGFVVESVSDVLNNPADDHTLSIRDASLGRNTDRFLIRARKPE